MADFYYLEPVDCRIKIQVCIGHFPDGRMRTRTFGVKNIRPDVSADDVAAVARAIAGLLAFPVVCARLVRKYLLNQVKKQDEKLGKKVETNPQPRANRQRLQFRKRLPVPSPGLLGSVF